MSPELKEELVKKLQSLRNEAISARWVADASHKSYVKDEANAQRAEAKYQELLELLQRL